MPLINPLAIFSSFKLWFFIGGLGLLTTVGYFGYKYVSNMQERVITLEKNLVLTEEALKESNRTIDIIRADIEKQAELRREFDKKLNENAEEVDKLRSLFNEHNFENLATQKPGLIERRINEASDKALSDLESITRSD